MIMMYQTIGYYYDIYNFNKLCEDKYNSLLKKTSLNS